MMVTPMAISFDDTTGSANRLPQTISISRQDTATAPLTGLVLGNITYVGPPGWLTATLSGTEAPATITLNANKGSLTPGTYSATIPVSSSIATNSPQNVTVTLKLVQRPPPPLPPGATVTVVAAGNLGCNGDLAKASAAAIAAVQPNYVFMLGDNAQVPGRVATLEDYMSCYDPVFGAFKAITYAAVGNGDQLDTLSATPGFSPGADAYFGAERVGPPGKNFYSFDIGSWHIIVLNVLGGGPDMPVPYNLSSEQVGDWLRRDLRDHASAKCTLAFWHDPLWMSSSRPETPTDSYPNRGYRAQAIRGTWMRLYDGNADVVVNGGAHIYERFAPMRYEGSYDHPDPTEFRLDSARGIVQFSSGLAGNGPTSTPSVAVTHPLSQYRSGGNGFLKLVLGDGAYSWEFVNSRFSHVIDSGSGTCH